MLPDIPNLKERFHKIIFIHNIMQRSHLEQTLMPFPPLIIHEGIDDGSEIIFVSQEGQEEKHKSYKTRTEITIEAKDVENVDYKEIIRKYSDAATAVTHEMNKSFINDLKEIAKSTGNIHDCKGKPFSLDEFLKIIENLNLSFEDGDKPYLQAFVGKDLEVSIKKAFEELEKSPALKQEFDEKVSDIINKKREEWYAREGHRELVD